MFSDDYCKQLYREIFNSKILFFVSLIKYFLRPFAQIIKFLYYPKIKYKRVKGNNIFIAGSINNYNSLINIYTILKDNSIIIKAGYTKNYKGYNLPMFIPSMLSFLFIPSYIYYYFSASIIEKKKLILFYEKILFSMGYKIFCNWFLKIYKPKSIIFANDHVFFTRIIVAQAEKMGIKTFYIQHASVTHIFPKIFSSYALLEGNDAKEKYILNGSDHKKIKLIGMPKYDGLQKYTNRSKKINSIAFCTTWALQKQDILKLIHKTHNHFSDFKLYFRPHTFEHYEQVYKISELPRNFIFSDPTKENVFQLLKKVDCIISGNSSILLEAALLNIIPFYFVSDQKTRYNDSNIIDDKYGYVKRGIAFNIHNLDDLVQQIKLFDKRKPNLTSKTQYYCSTVGTKWHGKSSILAANYIRKLN